jgi:hypothetical protein
VKISLAFCEAKLQIFCLQTPSLFVRSPSTLPVARVPPKTSSGKHRSDLPAPPDTGDPNVYRVVELHEVVMSLLAQSSSELWLRHVCLGLYHDLRRHLSERILSIHPSPIFVASRKRMGKWNGVGHRSRTPRRKRRSLRRRLEQQQAIEAVLR